MVIKLIPKKNKDNEMEEVGCPCYKMMLSCRLMFSDILYSNEKLTESVDKLMALIAQDKRDRNSN